MLLLSSGRIVDLVTVRAKYHALKKLAPRPDVEHKALYGLVDVVYRKRDENGEPKRGWTQYDYDYSGYTLDQLHSALDWNEAEKSKLYRWVSEDAQRQHIETVRRRLVDNQEQLSVKYYSAPAKLYSILYKRITALSLQKAKIKQWRSTIKNMQLRGEELIWSGLHHYLNKQDENIIISKQDILEAIDFSDIRLTLSTEQIWGSDGGLSFKELALKMPHQAVYRGALKLDETCVCVLRYVDETCNYRVGVIKTLKNQHDMALNKCWFAFDPYGRPIINPANNSFFFSESHAAKKASDNHAHKQFGLKNGVKYHTHYDHLTLYGGEDYREWIVSLPDYQRTFFGAHHFDHNVLVHLRTTSRQDVKGRKILFLEEVQSDWHQSGKTRGYDTSYWGRVANAPFKKEWLSLAIKLMLIQVSQNGYDGIAWPEGSIQENRYSKKLNAIKMHYDSELPKTLNKLGKKVNCRVEKSMIETRDPWLNLVKSNDKWSVEDGNGKFKTRDKYCSREDAMLVINRHCKSIDLAVNAFYINDSLRDLIACQGLPLFGESIV